MKTLLAATVMAALACASASAQKLNVDLSALAAKATAKSEITLEGGALDMFKQAVPVAKADEKDKPGDLGKMLSGIQGVVIRNYEFAKSGEYSDADLAPLRQQVGNGSGWSRIISAKESDKSTEIYVYNQGGTPGGMLLIAAEQKKLTVVHISGTVQLAEMKDLVNSAIHYDLASIGAADLKR
jgi:hypothetical protein